MSVTTFTLVVLVLYLVGLKFVSYFAYKISKNDTEDFFLSGRNVGLIALIGTTMASVFSTGTVISSPSEFFTKGTGYLWVMFFVLTPLVILLFGLKFWKLGKVKGFITPGDLLGDFYQCKMTKGLAAVIGLLCLIPYAIAQMVAIGKTFEALTGGVVTYGIGVTIVCIAIGWYLYFGGARAVIWTDVVQGIIFGALLIVAGVMVVQWAGGWQLMVDNLVMNAPEKTRFMDTPIIYFEYLLVCVSFLFLPYVWQRMYMAKNAKAVALNVAVVPIVFVLLFFITWVIGSSANTLFPNGLADGDSVMGMIFNQHAPYFGAFILVAAFAAGMSTVDSQMLSAGSLITHDINPLLGRHKHGQEYRVGRNWTLILLVVIYIASLAMKSVSLIAFIVLGISLTTLFIPVVLGMFYWKKASSAGAFWSMLIGLIVFVLKSFTPLKAYFPTELGGIGWSFVASLAVFVVVSLMTNGGALNEKRREYAKILS